MSRSFFFSLSNVRSIFQIVSSFQSQTISRSKAELFRDKLAHLLNIDRENVDVFSVQLRRMHPPLTDVRFAAHGSPYYKPVRLNGIVLMHREEVNQHKLD